MNKEMAKFEQIQMVMLAHGVDLILGLVLIVVGIFAIRYIVRGLRFLLVKMSIKEPARSTICNALHIILLVVLVSSGLVEVGFDSLAIRRLLIAIALAGVALVLLIRPYIPTLPFKVGQTVKAGNLLGKVEATTLINTRLRTFDGKILFVPNSKIINDIVQNYHYTPTRRVKLDVGIGYDQDLVKAKQVLETIMLEDPRVEDTPRPAVWVLNLASGCVELGGRCWVQNKNYWKVRCELIEKIKLRFDAEGIVIAYPQLDIHHYFERGIPPLSWARGSSLEEPENPSIEV